MSQIPVWYERKFDFTFPVEQYPNVCVRLRGGPARLEEIIRDVPREILVGKPENKWSVQEHAGHLLDLESLWLARVNDYQEDKGTLTVTDLRNLKTDEANYNGRELTGILAQFRAARLSMVDRVAKFPPEVFASSILHPRLRQPMRLVDHLYFVTEHDDHHLARIWEIIHG